MMGQMAVCALQLHFLGLTLLKTVIVFQLTWSLNWVSILTSARKKSNLHLSIKKKKQESMKDLCAVPAHTHAFLLSWKILLHPKKSKQNTVAINSMYSVYREDKGSWSAFLSQTEEGSRKGIDSAKTVRDALFRT